VKYISKYIYQKGESKVKWCLRAISARTSPPVRMSIFTVADLAAT
jgi:hypothetical protein